MEPKKILPQLFDLPKLLDHRGNLSYIEEETHFQFKIRRVYWIYDVPGGECRGGHVALSGSFDVVLNDGIKVYRYPLNRSYYGLLVPRMTWRVMENFSTNSLALVIASTDFDQEDYIRDFPTFLKLKEK